MAKRAAAESGSESRWTVVDFELSKGTFPVRAYLARLEGRNADDARALILLLTERGNMLREPHSKLVERDLFELRSNRQVRIFYTFQPGRVIVLLDGVIKKQDEIRRQDLERMREYLRILRERGPRAS
jgi:hypothetical protein